MNHRKKIYFIIGNRSHYARVKPIIKFLNNSDFKLILFESAVISDFANLRQEISQDIGQEKIAQLFTNVGGRNLTSMTKSTGLSIIELSSVFSINRPDIVVAVADRYEVLASAISARYMNIPVAHVQGGENSGSIDDSIRHSITKLSNLHLVSNKDAAKRIIKMGEDRKYVYVTGCPTIDLCKEINESNLNSNLEMVKDKYDIIKKSNFDFENKYIIVSFHPVTTEYEKNKNYFLTLINCVKKLNIPTIWIYPNIDAGSDYIFENISDIKYEYIKNNIYFIQHLSIKEYLAVLKKSSCIVGNSSVGIRESSFFGVPSVSLGTRQNMRRRANNVVDTEINEKSVYANVLAQLNHGPYPSSNIYGEGNAGEKIADILMNCNISVHKHMTY